MELMWAGYMALKAEQVSIFFSKKLKYYLLCNLKLL